MNRRLFNLLIVMFLSFFLITNVYADDYSDDIYDGDYSIEDMLQNYSVVTFGQKAYDEQVTMLRNTPPGSLQIFHIVGNFIVDGNIVLTKKDLDLTYSYNAFRADCRTLDNDRYSYVGNTIIRPFFYDYCENRLFSSTRQVFYRRLVYTNSYNEKYTVPSKYINIERLYSNIINNQNKIVKGKHVDNVNGVTHLEIGGEYYVDDINEIDSIIFDNFENNDDNLTIITINNSGSINFPKIYEATNNGEGNLVSSNDYIGMERPNDSYASYYVLDNYYGNIIWNVPNASYIELPSAPFIGHLIAPKADVEGPELHYAGAFLVNSLSLEDNSEAHFYPLTIINIPYRSNLEPVKAKTIVPPQQGRVIFNNNVNLEELEEGMVVSFSIEPEDNYVLKNIEIKDEEDNSVSYTEIKTLEYEFTMPNTNVTITPTFQQKNIIDVITNPKTGNILLFIIFMISLIIGISLFKKKESTKMK